MIGSSSGVPDGVGQPQQPAPAATAGVLAAGSQHAPALAAASAVPQHGPVSAGVAVVVTAVVAVTPLPQPQPGVVPVVVSAAVLVVGLFITLSCKVG
jgi:hypothetical protein